MLAGNWCFRTAEAHFSSTSVGSTHPYRSAGALYEVPQELEFEIQGLFEDRSRSTSIVEKHLHRRRRTKLPNERSFLSLSLPERKKKNNRNARPRNFRGTERTSVTSRATEKLTRDQNSTPCTSVDYPNEYGYPNQYNTPNTPIT